MPSPRSNEPKAQAMSENTRVLIIDDHPLFRRGVRQLLELEDQAGG